MPVTRLPIRAVLTALLLCVAGCGAQVAPGLESPPVGGPSPELPAPRPRDPSPPPPAYTARWSDPAAWPAGRVPKEGDAVVVPHGTVMLLDASTPPLASLTVDGAVVVAEGEVELTAGWVLVHGGLYAGSSAEPYRGRFTVTLAGPESEESVHGMGTKFLAAMGGTIELYGDMVGDSWTRLAADALPGDDVVTVQDATGWQAGDVVVVASTDHVGYERDRDEQFEVRTVVAVEGASLRLDRPLEYFHQGTLLDVGGIVVDERAEVARLTRNVVVRGDEASEETGFGGHVMVMMGGRLRLDAVELYRMGQRGRLARYPVHFHQLGADGGQSFVRRSSVHDAYHRCVTIHGTDGVLVEDVVAYRTYGHCFFLEDGDETGNELYRDLAMVVLRPWDGDAVLPTDASYLGPAAFWVTNPANDLVGNVAAGSRGTGFWYALPEHPTGLAAHKTDVWPRLTPLGRFVGNVAHSNHAVGLHVDNGPTADLRGTEPTWYEPRLDPADPGSGLEAVFEGLVAYKHRDGGAWLRGERLLLEGGVLADNLRGATFAAEDSGAVGVAFVGETPNVGTWPRWDDASEAAGRHLPQPWDPGRTVRGFEFYDGPVWVEESAFAGYASNAVRRAAALSYLDFTDFATSAVNHAAGLWFAPGTERVYLHSRVGQPGEGEDGYRSAVFLDLDGSVSGREGAWVTVSNPFLVSADCQRRNDWNAYVCGGRYHTVWLEVVRGPLTGVGPVTVTRGDGASHVMYGSPSAVPHYFRTVTRYGEELTYAWAGTPQRVRVGVDDGLAGGDAIVLSLPWAGDVHPYVDWWVDERNRAQQVGSLSELRAATRPSYYLAGGRLWLKLVVRDDRDWATLDLCTLPLCA